MKDKCFGPSNKAYRHLISSDDSPADRHTQTGGAFLQPDVQEVDV